MRKTRGSGLRGRTNVRLKVRSFAPRSASGDADTRGYDDARSRSLGARLASTVREFLRRVARR